MARVLLATVLATTSLGATALAGDTHDLCRAATVRVRNGSSLGTGVVFRSSEDYIYVLTNAHVAGTRLGTRVECEFWRHGHQSRPVAGETVVVAYAPQAYRDIAVVRIVRRLLDGYLPPVVPIADPNEQADYRRLFSVGCASGRWPTAFEGFALRRNSSGGDTVHFVPAPASGRSGSALFDVQGDEPRIVGLVAWRSSDEGDHGLDGRGEKHGYGIAMTHHEVWAGLRGEQQSISLAAPTGAIPVQHTEPDITKTETAERSVLNQPNPPTTPLETGGSDDVILLYSDPVAIGPKPEPPAVGDCEDGRCLPPQDSPGDPLFLSLPEDLGDSPDTPTPNSPASRDWLPWAIAIAAVIVLVGRPLLRVPGAAVEWFASRVEQRLQTHTQAPPQPTDKKA